MKSRKVPAHRLKKQPSGKETLERLKRWPGLVRNLLPDGVYIYCGQRKGYYREDCRGYADMNSGFTLWLGDIDEAMKIAGNCGPEKQIEFHSLF